MISAALDETGLRLLRPDGSPVRWETASAPVAYPDALATMDAAVADIAGGRGPERVWLLEHPPLYTAGTSARPEDLLDPKRLPVFRTGRGGQYTWHGPGQRVAYVMLDLNRRGPDIRAYVRALEEWLIEALADFGVAGERRAGRIGVWVRRPDKGPTAEDKIAAIGVRVRHWVTFHGIALNVAPDLAGYAGIVPCGITGYGVTSLADLGVRATMQQMDATLRLRFEEAFGPTEDGPTED